MTQKIKKLQNGLIALFSKLSDSRSKKTDENNEIKNKKESTSINRDKVTSKDVAIIGISGRFPKSPELESFWDNIVNGRDMISEIPKDRWDWRECFGDPHKSQNKTDSKWGGFLDDVISFDAGFFRISPKEAELMDPQQRLLMEEVWKAIEDAGYSPSSLSGTKTGIFIGASNNDYGELLRKEGVRQDVFVSTGSYFCMIPNRISYFLNLHGPSVAVDTACSASLVAIHQAVQAIRNDDCTMAIAGGVNLCLTPEKYFSFSHAGMLSPDGRCKTFDKRANGYVRAEGAGVILLKPLPAAIADGDPIYGKIKGTAQNHNGYGGFEHAMTAPNPEAQAELLISAYEDAEIPPDTVTFIEAHGSATALGDPFEITGLKKAFSTLYMKWGIPVPEKPYCGIGSVKSNMGHAEPASGIAGVLKVLLAMKHKTIPANLHLDELNPIIRLKNSPFYMVTETAEWKQLQDDKGQSIPRRAGVSSFGFGGANAHVVIEEYEDGKEHGAGGKEHGGQLAAPKLSEGWEDSSQKTEGKGAESSLSRRSFAKSGGQGAESKEKKHEGPYLIVLSAKNEERLKAYAEKLLDFVKTALSVEPSAVSLSDIAFTLQVGRDAMEERLGIIVTSIQELSEKLKGFLTGADVDNFYRGKVKRNRGTLAVFTADEDLHKAIDAWVAKGKHTKLLDLWVKGLTYDWNKLYGDVKPRRIRLPTYPFARERYWIPEGKKQRGEGSGQRKESREHGVKGGRANNISAPARKDAYKDPEISGGKATIHTGHLPEQSSGRLNLDCIRTAQGQDGRYRCRRGF